MSVSALESLTGSFNVSVDPCILNEASENSSSSSTNGFGPSSSSASSSSSTSSISISNTPVSVSSDQFVSLRYSFRPDLLDNSTEIRMAKDDASSYIFEDSSTNHLKFGQASELNSNTISDTPSSSSTTINSTQPSQNSENSYTRVCSGTPSQPQDGECILLYDPATKSFSLHPLTAFFRLSMVRKKTKVWEDVGKIASQASKDYIQYKANPNSVGPQQTNKGINKRKNKIPQNMYVGGDGGNDIDGYGGNGNSLDDIMTPANVSDSASPIPTPSKGPRSMGGSLASSSSYTNSSTSNNKYNNNSIEEPPLKKKRGPKPKTEPPHLPKRPDTLNTKKNTKSSFNNQLENTRSNSNSRNNTNDNGGDNDDEFFNLDSDVDMLDREESMMKKKNRPKGRSKKGSTMNTNSNSESLSANTPSIFPNSSSAGKNNKGNNDDDDNDDELINLDNNLDSDSGLEQLANLLEDSLEEELSDGEDQKSRNNNEEEEEEEDSAERSLNNNNVDEVNEKDLSDSDFDFSIQQPTSPLEPDQFVSNTTPPSTISSLSSVAAAAARNNNNKPNSLNKPSANGTANSKPADKTTTTSTNNANQTNVYGDFSSSSEDDLPNAVTIVESSSSKPSNHPAYLLSSSFSQNKGNGSGPMSLTAFVGNRDEEDMLSSSEEE